MEAMTTHLVTGITAAATECLEAMGQIVPAALPICGGMIVIMLGIRVFKRVAS